MMRTGIFLAVLTCGVLNGQRLYTLDGSIDLTAALDSNPQSIGFSRIPTQEENVPVFALYPSLAFESLGEHSVFRLGYGLGVNRVFAEQELDFISHSIDASISAQLSPRLELGVSNTFVRAPDFNRVSFPHSSRLDPDVLPFETVALRQKSFANQARAALEYQISSLSRLQLGAVHYTRGFDQELQLPELLSDQVQIGGDIGYSRNISLRTSWLASYTFRDYDFDSFHDSRSHSLGFGVTHQVSPTSLLQLSAGPVYLRDLEIADSHLGYQVRAGYSRRFERDRLALTYRRDVGSQSNVGSVSTNQLAVLQHTHIFDPDTSLETEVGAFHSSRRFDNPLQARGFQGSLVLNRRLSRNWLVSFGGFIRDQAGTELIDFDRRQLFVSLRLGLPDLLRIER